MGWRQPVGRGLLGPHHAGVGQRRGVHGPLGSRSVRRVPPCEPEPLEPGDLLFYDFDGTGIDHVVMYVGPTLDGQPTPYGSGTIIQAAHTGTVVTLRPGLVGGLRRRRPAVGRAVSPDRPSTALPPRVGLPRTMTLELTIVVPAFNEAHRLPEGIKRFDAAVDEGAVDIGRTEVLVVDDGSTDGTAAAARALLAHLPHHRVVSHPANRGKGGSRSHRGGAGPRPVHRLHGRRYGHRPASHPGC